MYALFLGYCLIAKLNKLKTVISDTEVEVHLEETLPTEDRELNLPQKTPEKSLSVPGKKSLLNLV